MVYFIKCLFPLNVYIVKRTSFTLSNDMQKEKLSNQHGLLIEMLSNQKFSMKYDIGIAKIDSQKWNENACQNLTRKDVPSRSISSTWILIIILPCLGLSLSRAFHSQWIEA